MAKFSSTPGRASCGTLSPTDNINLSRTFVPLDRLWLRDFGGHRGNEFRTLPGDGMTFCRGGDGRELLLNVSERAERLFLFFGDR